MPRDSSTGALVFLARLLVAVYRLSVRWLLIVFLALTGGEIAAANFTVGTYNLELYLDATNGLMKPKPDGAKAMVLESILKLNADILAIQEMGKRTAFDELRANLKAGGLDYPHTEFIRGADDALHVAVLSKYPIVRRRPHTNESFLLNGRRLRVLRGFAEVDIKVENYEFTLITTHLKSKRQSGANDEEDVREQEAIILREKIDAILTQRPTANLVVLGDLNDFRDARSTRAVIGRGAKALVDTRPAERNGDSRTPINQPYGGRQVVWTHYYAKEESYARLDYILVSRGMSREWQIDGTYILTVPNWGLGSDHRPLLATFSTNDK
jgi:endonuclease/exonuclease/phosphatase family metal-dependent hydrolase